MIEAAGAMGWTEREFWLATPAYFFRAYRGFCNMQQTRNREAWEQARFVALYTVAPHSKKTLRLTDITRFPWEAPIATQFVQLSPEAWEKFNREADEVFLKHEQSKHLKQ